MRVLIVEDDPMIGRALATGLQESGHAADWVRDGVAAETALGQGGYDVALLDLALPRKEGLEVLKSLRSANVQVPVLVISARVSLAERIAGLDSGADDYLTKPFDLDEVLARMRAVLRRHAGRGSPEVSYGALTLDPVNREVRFRGKPVALSSREFGLLEALMKNPGALVTRERLVDSVYGWGAEVESNSVEVHLHHLRRKLSAELILNVRGVGYRLVPLD
jgi:two-component system, OmpR family, response regulator QseB